MATVYRVDGIGLSFIVKDAVLDIFFFILGYLFVCYIRQGSENEALVLFLYCFFLADALPCAILQWQYLRVNRCAEFTIDVTLRVIQIERKASKCSYRFDEIESIQLALMPALWRGERRGMVAWERYHFAIVTPKTGPQFVITCLVAPDLRSLFEPLGLDVKRRRVYFPNLSRTILTECAD